MDMMRISQLTEHSGVPATTLRFYESAGLLPADRSPAGYRLYGEDAVQRLAFIAAAKHLGLPLGEIGELLRVWESGACREVKADLRPRIAARIADAENRAVELSAFTAVLHGALEHLDVLPERDHRCDAQCSLLSPGRTTSGARPPSSGGLGAGAERWRTQAVACSLGESVPERAGQWRRLLSGARREEIEDGVRLLLPSERTSEIAALAATEQQCCPFFDFRLHLDGPVLGLEVRAPAEGAGMLAELFTTVP